MAKFINIFLLFSFSTYLFGDIEPNNSFSQANDVEPHQAAINGTLAEDINGSFDRQDWYKFTVSTWGRFSLSGSVTGDVAYSINLYEEDGTTIIEQVQSPFKTGVNPVVELAASLSPGIYYFRIYSTTGNPWSYSLTSNYYGVWEDDESNNDTTQAISIGADQIGIKGNLGHRLIGTHDLQDWYTFNVSQTGRLTIDFLGDATLRCTFKLYEGDGMTLIGISNTFPSTSNLGESLSPGTYYLLLETTVNQYNDNYGAYEFDMDYDLLLPDNEPNDSMAEAVSIHSNQQGIIGNLGHRKIGHYDDVDWYTFQLNNSGRLLITNEQLSSTLKFRLELYNDCGRQIFLPGVSDEWSETEAFLSEGTYFILLQRDCGLSDCQANNSTFYGPYEFNLNYQYIPSDEEDNDVPLQAEIKNPNQKNNVGTLGFQKKNAQDLIDWYKITTISTGNLVITNLTPSDPEVNFAIDLFESDGITKIRDYVSQANDKVEASLFPGDYFIRVNRNFGIFSYAFDLNYEAVLPDEEPNDIPQDAISINHDQQGVIGNLGHRRIGSDDVVDWYKFSLYETKTLTIYDRTRSTKTLNYDLVLYQSDAQTKIREINRHLNNTGGQINATLDAGDYYLKFERNSLFYGVYYLDMFCNAELQLQNMAINSSKSASTKIQLTSVSINSDVIFNAPEIEINGPFDIADDLQLDMVNDGCAINIHN